MPAIYDNIHDGHRARMKEKMTSHGFGIFHTYELLEMLLYYAVPTTDTKPLAKRLLARFGSVGALFCATKEELTAVEGIGDRTAELILTAADMLPEGELSQYNRAENIFDDYEQTGLYLARYLEAREGLGIVALLLDGNMRLVDKIELYGVDFGSGAVRSRRFIDAALSVGATVIVFGFTRPHAALYPLPCDLETSRMLSADLGAVGVRVAECFVTAGEKFLGVNAVTVVRLGSDSEELSRFLDAQQEGGNG